MAMNLNDSSKRKSCTFVNAATLGRVRDRRPDAGAAPDGLPDGGVGNRSATRWVAVEV
jgi:hypothetical protein